jgi:hypothetical protein
MDPTYEFASNKLSRTILTAGILLPIYQSVAANLQMFRFSFADLVTAGDELYLREHLQYLRQRYHHD